MKSAQKEIKALQTDIRKTSDGFVKCIENYKKQDSKRYDDCLWAPVIQKRNIDYLTEIDASFSFLQVSVDSLLDNKTAGYRKKGYAEMLEKAVNSLKEDVELFLKAPGISAGEKEACTTLNKQLSDLKEQMKPFIDGQNNKPKAG